MAYVVPPGGATGEIAKIRGLVAKYYPVYEMRVTPQSLVLAVQSDPATLAERFDELRRELWPLNYIPTIRQEHGETVVEVLRRPARTPWRPVSNIVMLVLTTFTCLFAGAFLWVSYQGGSALTPSSLLWGGVEFALPLLAILGFHELAHFLVARKRDVEASLPFFIPMPPPFVIFGTFGAFISLREPIPDRKVLVEIGASGPLAGFVLAIPVTLIGLFLSAHSPVILPLNNCGPVFLSVPYGDLVIGTSVLFYALGLFVPVGATVGLSPVAIAGWVGLLVTAINLLPAGQLDGGHVFRALLGPRSVYISWAAVGALFVLGIWYPGWWIFGFLVLFLGARHPPPLNDITPLDWKRKAIGLGAVAILITGFAWIPITSPSGSYSVNDGALAALGSPENHSVADINFTLVNNDIVPHAFAVQASIALQGASAGELKSFLANTSWALYQGSHLVYALGPGQEGGAFNMPWDVYLSVNGSALGQASLPVTLQFSNPQPAYLQVTVTVNELCRNVQDLADATPIQATYPYPTATG